MSAYPPNNVKFIRLMFALSVVYSHSYLLSLGNEGQEPFMIFSGQSRSLGGYGVAGFFFLSGLLNSGSWQRSSSWRSFATKRIKRIYPGFLTAFILVTFVLVPLVDSAGAGVFAPGYLASNVVRALALRKPVTPPVFQDVPFRGVINGSLWTITFEVWTYAGIAAIGASGILARRWALLALFAASIVASVAFDRFDINSQWGWFMAAFGWPRHWARLLPMVLAGIIVYAYPALRAPKPWAMAVAAVGFAIGLIRPPLMEVAMPTCFAYLLAVAALGKQWGWAERLTRRGDISYGIFLYSFPIQQTIMKLVGYPIGPMDLLAISILPILAAGAGSCLLVERWFGGKARLPRPAFRLSPSNVPDMA